MKLKFLSLASGSSGNCYYLGTEEYGILIDAGIGIRTIKKELKDLNIAFENIIALFITHDHADHIKSAGFLGEKYDIPVYSTEAVHTGMNKSYGMTQKIYQSKRIVIKEETTKLNDFNITPFEVPHDGTDNVGYFIEFGDIKIAVATDLGHVTQTVRDYMSKANYLILEANYDEEMLTQGSYPPHLKQRILGYNGHLSNKECAEFLAQIYHPDMKYVFLCHLSRDNNHPELALKTIEYRLLQNDIKVGKDLEIVALKRNHPSDLYDLV
ncbi:MAG: MBL fold metallo-hydrolase [Bacteroidales bacterium]|nr:MBL fold metallo-hydrolase [Bacteroidales bacterium]